MERDFPISLMCKVLKLSRSGYYAWCKRKLSPRNQENEILSEQIKQIHESSRQTYGSPRIKAALVARGFKVGRNRVVRLMAKVGICGRLNRKFRSMAEHMRTDLILTALEAALGQRIPSAAGLVFTLTEALNMMA
jgi:HTH-like domain